MPHGLVQRAKIVLLAHAGHKNTEISRQLSIQEENAGSGESVGCQPLHNL